MTVVQKIQAAWNNFSKKISEIRQRQLIVLNSFVEKIRQKKIKAIQKKLNKN